MVTSGELEYILKKLDSFVTCESYSGFDPYDALNTSNFLLINLARNRYLRLLMIQGLKRIPLNLRVFLGIRKERNPKAIALFLSSLVDLYSRTRDEIYLKRATELADWLLQANSSGSEKFYAWGYNFPWQSSAFYLPRNYPNMVATTYTANALLDLAAFIPNENYKQAAYMAAKYILNKMLRKSDGTTWFSYTPLDHTKVVNINFMGAYLLARAGVQFNDQYMIDLSKAIVSFAVGTQNEDGSWPYSIAPEKRWVDNFHTGFNLEFLHKYQRTLQINDFREQLEKGFEYFDKNMVTREGVPKYYDDSLYPIDIHSCAQSIITYIVCKNLSQISINRAEQVLDWTVNNMFNKNGGYFYYQKYKYYTIRIPYMRWAQAWMYRALTLFLLDGSY